MYIEFKKNISEAEYYAKSEKISIFQIELKDEHEKSPINKNIFTSSF